MGTFGATCVSWTYPKYPRNPGILRHGDLWCYLCVLDLPQVSQESWDTPTWGPLVLHMCLGPIPSIPGIPGYSDMGTFGATCASWTYPKYPRNPGILRHGDLWCYLCVLDLPQVSQESRDTPTWGPLVLHMCLGPIPSIPGIPGYSDMGTFGATCASWTYPKYPRNPGILRHGDLWCYLCVLDLSHVSQESWDTPTWGPLVLYVRLGPIPSIPGIPGYSDIIILCILSDIATCVLCIFGLAHA